MRIQLIGAPVAYLPARDTYLLAGDIIDLPADAAAKALEQPGMWRAVDASAVNPEAPQPDIPAVGSKEDVHVHQPGDAGQPPAGRRAGGKRRA